MTDSTVVKGQEEYHEYLQFYNHGPIDKGVSEEIRKICSEFMRRTDNMKTYTNERYVSLAQTHMELVHFYLQKAIPRT